MKPYDIGVSDAMEAVKMLCGMDKDALKATFGYGCVCEVLSHVSTQEIMRTWYKPRIERSENPLELRSYTQDGFEGMITTYIEDPAMGDDEAYVASDDTWAMEKAKSLGEMKPTTYHKDGKTYIKFRFSRD